MNRKYDEAIEHIKVTPEMRDRILKKIETMDFEEKRQTKVLRFPNVKYFAAAAACLAFLFVGALTIPDFLNSFTEPPVLENSGITEVSSVTELSETVGFKVEEPGTLPFDPQNVVYTAYWTEMAEITYTDAGQTAVFRKGVGTKDVSGDYNSYEFINEISAGSIGAALKGSSEAYTLAIGTDGEFAYSLSLSDGIGESEWIALLQTIK